MKVLYFTKYSRNGASSRLRSYQFFPFLENEGIKITVKPFFNEEYLNNLYSGKKTALAELFLCYWNRFVSLFLIYKYDRIVIEKELFPYFFSWFEKGLCYFGVKYIVDYDDAIFHNYDRSNNKWILFFLKNKINNVMKYSGCVMAGNSYLAQRAIDSGAEKVVIQPTVINTDKYIPKKKHTATKVIIGWIGSPSTIKYVKNIKPVLEEIIERFDVELHIIGVEEDLGLGDKVKYLNWTEETEVEQITKFDIGIMPLENTPWELGKCSYKIIQYMGCAIPVVASPVGMNNEVVEEGVNGFLALNNEDWTNKLSLLISDSDLRERLGKKGRIKVEQHLNVQMRVKKLIESLNSKS